ncbi:alpha/beta hydrolase [Halocynthiibacter sp.]|uniref:alpha/beta hydrolase n=1 Tax=Halocynthiibacter sp. TaxID=1979210 RepID=UPI003C63CF07
MVDPADAVLAFSPQTDVTLQSPSLLKRLIFAFMMHQGRPDDPCLSPLHGDLSQLPPVLIQTSDHDMFEDDCVRFINKMNAFDSMGTLQIWPGMLYVWQAFDTPEGNAALVDGAHFLQRHS